MPSVINTNISSLNAQRNLSASQSSLNTSMQRLSSGLRVNSAKDDAAGLAIAERMNAQVRGMNVAIRNANDGISLAQTAEGSLGKIADNLQRMRELAVQAANDTNGSGDRAALDDEFKQLAAENERVINSTKFNGITLLTVSGAASQSFAFQIGANNDSNERVTITANNFLSDANMSAVTGSLGTLESNGSYLATTAQDMLTKLDAALDAVNKERSAYGAYQNRFEAIIANLQVASENQAAARSRIMDADFAQETANLSRAQILQQAGTAMVAQANQLPQTVMQLLQG